MAVQDLDALLISLDAMDLRRLRNTWQKQLRTSPPGVSAGLLRLALAHALQEKALGGLSKAAERQLRRMEKVFERTSAARANIRTPARTTIKSNRTFGGALFSRGQIYKILGNPIYVGRIPHGATSYPGLHPAIIEQDVWEQVQQMLMDNRTGRRSAPINIRHPSILAGKLFDEWGEALVATHANKGKVVRYRYYVSRQLQHGGDASANPGMRIPAREIEALVIERIAKTIDDPIRLLSTTSGPASEGHTTIGTNDKPASRSVGQQDIPALVEKARELASCLREHRDRHDGALQALIGDIVDRIDIAPSEVCIMLDPAGLDRHLGTTLDPESSALRLVVPARLRRSGLAVRMVLEDGCSPTQTADTSNALITAVAKARYWWKQLCDTPGLSVAALARQEGCNPTYINRILRLAFLDPKIVQAILDGAAPIALTLERLTRGPAFPPRWQDQREMLGITTRP